MTLPAYDASDVQNMPMAEVLGRVGTEISELATLVDHLQGLVSPLLADVAKRHPASVRELQKLDYISQNLFGICTFLQALGPMTAAAWHLDAAKASSGILLSDLSERLGGTGRKLTDVEQHGQLGDFELF